jgi:tetratricopeptide (TPR) repeat protein
MKTITHFAILIAALSLIAASGFFIRRHQQLGNEARSLAEQAREAQQNSDFEKAESLYQQYLSHAPADLRAGHVDSAIKILEDDRNADAGKSELRWTLANLFAERGDTDKLLRQINELETTGFARPGMEYLTAYYYVNAQQFAKARQHLSPLASMPHLASTFKARVNDLLSRCYAPWEAPQLRPLGMCGSLAQQISATPQPPRRAAELVDVLAGAAAYATDFWSLTERGALNVRTSRSQEAVPRFIARLFPKSRLTQDWS